MVVQPQGDAFDELEIRFGAAGGKSVRIAIRQA